MVSTSVPVTPACGAAAVSCCNDRSAPLGGISNAGRWAGASSSVGGGRAGGQRCSAATAAGMATAVAAGVAQTIKSSSVAVGAVDFAGGADPRAVTTGGECELLLLRRVHSCGDRQGLHHCPAAAAQRSAGAGPAEVASTLAAAAGTGGTGGEAAETARVFCGPTLHRRPMAEERGTLSCRNSRVLLSSNKEEWGLKSNRLSPTVVMGTSCPDFLLFFPRSPKRSYNGAENAEKALLLAAAPGATNGFESSTCGSACGSACVSTDDERATGCSREDQDASKKYQRLSSPPRAYSAEVHAAAAPAAGMGEVPETASAAGLGEVETAIAAQVVLSPQVMTAGTPAGTNGFTRAATLASPAGRTTSAEELAARNTWASVQCTSQPLAHAAEQLCGTSATERRTSGRYTDGSKEDDAQKDGPKGEATLEVLLLGSGAAAGAAAEEAAAPPVGSTTIGEAAALGEEAARETTKGLVTDEGADTQAAEEAAEKNDRCDLGVEGSVPEMEKIRDAAGACSKVDAAVLFPSPQPPSLPQLLQLPDVYDAAVLALRVLPERYMQRIQQLDALETVCPSVYGRCSYLARVRQIYVISAELTLRQKEVLLQQLLQERSSRQRSRKCRVELPQQQQEQQQEEGQERRSQREEEEAEDEEDEEDGSCSWNGDREQHKALHAVADLFRKIKAVQARVGPTLLAGAAQLADALQALEQQERKRKNESSGTSCPNGSSNTGEQSMFHRNCNCSSSSSENFHNNSLRTTCSTFILSNASVNGVNKETGRTTDRTKGRNNGDNDSASGAAEDASSVPASCGGTFCIGHCSRGVQTLVDNFLHSFFSCRVAAELQREHFLLAVQSGDCGAILSSCLPMEKLIFQAALDAQELALHHLGIAAPVEVWVGEAGEADQQLRAFLLAASLHEGPVAIAWSACSSPRSDAAGCRPDETDAAPRGVAAGVSAAVEEEDTAGCVRGGTTDSTLASCPDLRAQQQQQQEGWKGVTGGGEGSTDTAAAGRRSSSRCSACLSSSFASASASPRWTRWGRDTHSSSAFSRDSSRSRNNPALPGTVRFPCFASYAYSGIFELLKNSMRASVEAWRLNRFTRNTSGINGGGSEMRSNSAPDAGGHRSSRSDSENDEQQQKWRLLSVKRSRKLKKLPGRVRLQRCCIESAAARQRGMMACSEDLAAAADQERAARSRNKENNQWFEQGQPQRHVEHGDLPAREEETSGEVVQLEDGVLQPIKVLLLFIDESLIIRIEDHGEGLRQNELQNVWSFAYTTAAGKGLLQRLAAAGEDGEQENEEGTATETRSMGRETNCSGAATAVPPLAGCGVGLPMSRVHAQSLGGDIFLESAEGIGTCAYMCLSNLQGFRDRLYEQHRSRQQRST